MHKDDIERAGIPDRRVFFDFCPQQCRKEEKRREKKGKEDGRKHLKERQFYYAYILTPQHQHYAEIDWPRSIYRNDDDEEEGEGDEEEGDEHQVRQIESRRRYSRAVGNTFWNVGKPTFWEGQNKWDGNISSFTANATSKEEAIGESASFMRVSDKHCRVDFDGFEQIFADIPYWEREEQLFLFFAGRKMWKDNKDQIGFNEEAENEDSSKEEGRNISICTSGTSKEVLCLHIIDSTCGKLGLLAAQVIETSESGGKDVMWFVAVIDIVVIYSITTKEQRRNKGINNIEQYLVKLRVEERLVLEDVQRENDT